MSYRPKDAELLVGLWGLVPQPIRGKGRGRTQAPSVGECAGSGREPRPISKTGDPSRVAWNHRQCQTVSLCVYGRSRPPRESTAVNISVWNAPVRGSVSGGEPTASTLLGRHASEPVQAWHVRWTQVADALRAVSEARVRREVGVEPEAEVLERLAALPLFHGLDIPGATMAEKGRAVERVLRRIVEAVDAALQPFQKDATPTGSGPDRGLPLPVSGQLAPSPYFTDRHRELGDLDQWLLDQPDHRTNRVMMITGTAGVGKTALARRWLHSLGDRFPDGELCADLRGYGADGPKAPGEILGQFLRVLGVPSERVPGSLDEQTALYRSLTASRRMLVLLDDAASTTQVRPLLPGSSDTVVVVTSRRRLGGLLAAGAALLPLGPLREPAAVELLARFIGTKRVDAERAAARALVQLCGCLPIALSVEDVSVRAAFDLSYQTLPADTARLYRTVGLLPGADFNRAVVAAAADLPIEEADRLLGMLVDASMLEERGEDSFGLHDLLHLHARLQAEASDPPAERQAVVRRAVAPHRHRGRPSRRGLGGRDDAAQPPRPGLPRPRPLQGGARLLRAGARPPP